MIILNLILSFLTSNAGKSLEVEAVNALTYLISAAIRHGQDTSIPATVPAVATPPV
jgi:hypothetical protein